MGGPTSKGLNPAKLSTVRTCLWLCYALVVWASGCFVLWLGYLREAPTMWMSYSDYPTWFRELAKHSYLRLVVAQAAQTVLIWFISEGRHLGIRHMAPAIQCGLGLIALQLLVILTNTLR